MSKLNTNIDECPLGKAVVVRIEDGSESSPYYYLCVKEKNSLFPNLSESEYVFTEAAGEQYYGWEQSEVVGWISVKDLDEILEVEKVEEQNQDLSR